MRLPHVEAHARIVTREIGNRLWQGMKAQCRRAADRSSVSYPRFRLSVSALIRRSARTMAFASSRMRAKGGRQDALTRPDHQLEAQPAFHQLHVAGQCRLRQPERGRRAGKGPGADDFMELKEVAGVYRAHEVSYQKLM